MDLLPGRPLLVLAMLAGCYSPHDAVSTGGGDESGSDTTDAMTSGPTTGAMTTAPTTAPTSTSSPEGSATDVSTSADDTAGDAPPELTSFSVNGSETPSEILEADLVEIQVAAMDDVGIDRVEFYDGDTLIAEFTEPPYHTEFLVTSTENGGHSYTAVAYDTAEQTAEAGPIPLSVTIDGGAVLELREDIFVSRTGFSTFGTPKVSVDDADHVFVSGTSQYVGSGFTKGRWTVLRYSPELGLLWDEAYPSSMTSMSPNRASTSVVRPNADGLWLGTASIVGGEFTSSLYPYDLDDGAIGGSVALGGSASGAYSLRGLAVDTAGNLYATGPAGTLAKFEPGVSDAAWEIDALEGQPEDSFIVGVSIDADDGALVDVACFLAGCDESALRKVSKDGDLLWTRSNSFTSVGLTDGSSVSVAGASATTGLEVWHRDANGNELDTTQIDELIMIPMDIAAAPDGDVVVAGWNGNGPMVPVVVRLTAAGEVVWVIEPEVGDGDTAIASGVAVTDGGRLYVVGTANAVIDGPFGNDIGDAWIADIAL